MWKNRITTDPAVLGLLCALGGNSIWGALFPVYFKALSHVPAFEVLAHRIVWSVALLAAALWLLGRRSWFAELRSSRQLGYYLATSLLIGANWVIYIWAVQHSHILAASLGYYINPLASVLLGVVFLRERLHPRQWLAVAIAAAGVASMALNYGEVPWISLALAGSFSSYGLLHKKAGMDSLGSLFLETLLLTPVALGFLLVLAVQHKGALGTTDPLTTSLLLLCGVATVAPLILFLEAIRRLRLATIGLLFYLTPTLQFLLAVVVYREPFTTMHLLTFACIWTGLALYSVDAVAALRLVQPEQNKSA